jgi:hypothetical protein
VNATGNLDVWEGFNPDKAPVDAFQVPGRRVVHLRWHADGGCAGVQRVDDNGGTASGCVLQSTEDRMLGLLATNGNSWGNWSTMPASGTPTVCQINPLAPTTFGFVNNPDAVHKNPYSSLIMGGPTCFTPAPAAWTGDP